MPTVTAQGQTIECEPGANLRQVLLQHGIALHNDRSQWSNCRGIGTCGTCAVQIQGLVSETNWREQTRRSHPPHSLMQDRRLACQTRVLGDPKVTKFDGFWRQDELICWSADG
ncbi:MAG: (2Fe-2S)-binding protein [Synechococcales cyanobacterium C42_A2020_086]|nr:(2Fe-2S)-binding protein [Synechococcales cyanobacterium C42_A2020_086]